MFAPKSGIVPTFTLKAHIYPNLKPPYAVCPSNLPQNHNKQMENSMMFHLLTLFTYSRPTPCVDKGVVLRHGLKARSRAGRSVTYNTTQIKVKVDPW
jgi:hypothetical protein